MKVLAVDLRSPYRPPRWVWAMMSFLLVGAVATGLLAYREAAKLNALKAELTELQRQLAQPKTIPPVVPQKMPYDASAREMLALATSDWPAMLTALESVGMVGVTPTSIEISPAERWIRVEVEFSDYAKLLEYVEALNSGDPKPKWSLVQAQATVPSSNSASNGTSSTATVRGTW